MRQSYKRSLFPETQKTIIKYILEGKTNPEISAELNMKLCCVETNLLRIYKKVGARNKHHATAIISKLDYMFEMSDRFGGVPMKFFNLPKREKRISNYPELW